MHQTSTAREAARDLMICCAKTARHFGWAHLELQAIDTMIRNGDAAFVFMTQD